MLVYAVLSWVVIVCGGEMSAQHKNCLTEIDSKEDGRMSSDKNSSVKRLCFGGCINISC